MLLTELAVGADLTVVVESQPASPLAAALDGHGGEHGEPVAVGQDRLSPAMTPGRPAGGVGEP
jgi:hypothetical protein